MRYLPILLLLLAACSKGTKNGEGEPGPPAGDKAVITLEETGYAFRNPMKGFREFFDVTDPVRAEYPLPFGSMIKIYMPWKRLENSAADGMEKIVQFSNQRWAGLAEKNLKVIPRVYLDWPYSTANPNFPDALWGTHWPADLTTGDYTSDAFKNRLRALVQKLGAAWDNDARVAYVEMGIIGQWGEQHDPDINDYWATTSGVPHVPGKTWLPGMDTLLGNAFKAAFKNKKVLVRYAYDFKEYAFGNYWDSWGMPEEQARGYDAIKKQGDRWKTQPVGGEITWNWGTYQTKYGTGHVSTGLKNLLADEQERARVIGQIRSLHCNHLGGVTWTDFTDASAFLHTSEVQKALGYRFVIKEAAYAARQQPGARLDLRLKIVNNGSSPFYYNWPVAVYLLDRTSRQPVWSATLPDVNIAGWMPGEDWDQQRRQYVKPAPVNEVAAAVQLPASLAAGHYILAVAIHDPAGNKPSLRFANKNYFNGGYTPLGYIGIDSDVGQTTIDKSNFDDIYADLTLKYTP